MHTERPRDIVSIDANNSSSYVVSLIQTNETSTFGFFISYTFELYHIHDLTGQKISRIFLDRCPYIGNLFNFLTLWVWEGTGAIQDDKYLKWQ